MSETILTVLKICIIRSIFITGNKFILFHLNSFIFTEHKISFVQVLKYECYLTEERTYKITEIGERQ